MPHCEPRWHGASTLLLVVAVAAVTVGLGAVAAEIAVDAVPVPTLPLAEPPPHRRGEGTVLREDPRSGPRDRVRSACAGIARIADPGREVAAIHVTPGALGSPSPPVDAAAQPSSDDDPRVYLAHMTAVQHRQGLPLPGDIGRLLSLIIAATPDAP